jgi:phosphohistidine phosphatase
VKRLTLVRHADSGWGHASQADVERALSARGKREATHMVAYLVAAKVAPTLIITSPATRARATARIFASAFGYAADRIREAEDAYLASPAELLDLVHRLGGRSRHVMLFGHNPGISRFAGLLAGDDSPGEMPACAVASLVARLRHWPELQLGQAVTDFYQSPKSVL